MREEGEGETRGREAEARKKLFPHLGPRLSERGKRSEVRAATFRVGWVAVNGLAISSFFPLLIFSPPLLPVAAIMPDRERRRVHFTVGGVGVEKILSCN